AVEVWLQAHQVDRESEVRRKTAAQHLAGTGVERVRLLRERQPDGRSSALEPGDRAADRRGLPAQDAQGQRLRRSGAVDGHRNGSAAKLLIPDRVLRFIVKPIVFVAALGPLGWLVWAGLTGHLSANPLSDITNHTGDWTIRFICITLAITP